MRSDQHTSLPRSLPGGTPPGGLSLPARLVGGGLSVLLVLSFALAAGVLGGTGVHLLATVGGRATGGLDRAVAPQGDLVERRARRLQQDKPPAPAAGRLALNRRVSLPGGDKGAADGSLAVTPHPTSHMREELLALPPPAL